VSDFAQRISSEIDAEISRLQQARSLLVGPPQQKKLGRPVKQIASAPAKSTRKKRQPLSEEAKQRMREAQLKRWADVRKAKPAKTSSKKSSSKKPAAS
jgi:hypothetical protein